MANYWPLAKLSELLMKSDEWIELKPDRLYQEVTVRLWGKGVVQRREVAGMEIASEKRVVVRPKQFILSRIDARNGALGIVPEALDGAVVSSDFPVFNVNRSRLLPEFLEWMSKTTAFVDLCKAASEGTTNRVRLKEDRLLAMEIPLPPLPEQQHMVARIEALARRVEEARGLRGKAVEKCDILLRSMIFDESNGAPTPTSMRELVRLREPDVIVRPEETYHFAGVYCFGKGVFRGQRKSGMNFAYPRLTRLRTGNFVYPKLMAWEGALGVVPPECDGLVVSTEFPVFEIDQSRVLPEILDVYFRTPSVWPTLSAESTGTNVRRRRLSPTDFFAFKMPLPPMSTQFRLREVKAKIDKVRQLQVETQKELDALMPSVLAKAFAGEL